MDSDKVRHSSGEIVEERVVLFDRYEQEHPGLFKDLFSEIIELIPDNKSISKKQGSLRIGDYVEHEELMIDKEKHFGVFVCGVGARDKAADSDNPEIYARGDIDDSILIMVHGNRKRGYHYVTDDRMLVKFALKDFEQLEWRYGTYGVEQPVFDEKTGEFCGIEINDEALAIEEKSLEQDDDIMKKMVNAIRKLPYKNIDEYVEKREKEKIGKVALK